MGDRQSKVGHLSLKTLPELGCQELKSRLCHLNMSMSMPVYVHASVGLSVSVGVSVCVSVGV